MRRTLPAAVLTAGFCATLLTSVYLVRGHREPLGFDTARYLWRDRCVAEHGIRGLRSVCRPPLATSMPSRVGYPLVGLPLGTVTGAEPLALAAAMPVALITTLALAAGALVASASGLLTRAVVLSAVAVGGSSIAARMWGPEGYSDNILAAALGVGALGLLGGSARRQTLSAALIGAAGITHWPTFATFLAVLTIVAVLSVPETIRARRTGKAWKDTPSVRVMGTVLGALTLWGAVSLVLGGGPDRFFADPASSAAKLRADLGSHLFPVTIPLAAAGAWWLARRRSEEGSQQLERVLLAWTLVIAAAVAAWVLNPALPPFLRRAGEGFPLHRILLLALPLPILAGLAISRLTELSLPRIARGILIGLAVLAWTAIGYRVSLRHEPYLSLERVAHATGASDYLEDSVPPGTPVVLVVDGVGSNPYTDLYLLADTARVPLAPERVPALRLYLGGSGNLRAGRPTRVGERAYDAASLTRWREVAPILSRPHVALVLRSFTPEYESLARAEPHRVATPGVFVLEGPPPGAAAARRMPSAPVSPLGTLVLALAVLGSLGAVGLGWAIAATRGSRAAPLLAPAMGAGALILAGVALAPTGLRPSGAGGVVLLLIAAAPGWVTAFRWQRRRFDRASGRL